MIAYVQKYVLNRNWLIIAGVTTFILIFVLLLASFFLNDHDPFKVNTADRLQSPSTEHLLGTDQLGRDILARLTEGSLYTIGISLLSIFISLFIGLPVGMLSGFVGKKIDRLFMRIIDGFVAFPDFLLAIAITGLLGPGIWNVMIAIVSVKWVGYARLTRSIVLTEKHKDYMTMSVFSGSSIWKIMHLHLFKHIVPQVLVLASLDIGKIILLISSLSYIGLGAQPPLPEWGAMLNEGRLYFQTAPNLIIFPGIAIMLVVISFNLIGDGLRDQLDVYKSKRKR